MDRWQAVHMARTMISVAGPGSLLAAALMPAATSRNGKATVFPGMIRDDEQAILAVHRLGRDRGTTAKTKLEVGDTRLIQGSWDALGRTTEDSDVLVVDSPDLVRQQAAPLGPAGYRALAVLAAWWSCSPPVSSSPR